MNASEQSRLSLWCERVSPTVAGVAVVVGVLVLFGWLFDVDELKSVLPGLTAMKANTAVGFILSGVSLWSSRSGAQGLRILAQVCAAVVMLLGLLTLGEYLSGVDFGIDQWLFRDLTHLDGDIPGRMAVNTAISFPALGAALLLLSQRKGGWVVAIHVLAIVPVVVAGSALIGYAYHIEAFFRVGLNYTPMALNTAVLFVMLGLGVVNARPDYPFRRFMTSDNAAGIAVRRLLPAAVGFILVTGWLILEGYLAGYFSGTIGLALFVAVSLVGQGGLILWYAGMLYEAETALKRVEERNRYLAAIVESSEDAITGKTLDGIITSWNRGARRLYGYTASAAVGQPVSMLLPPGYEDELSRIMESIKSGGHVDQFETLRRNKDGKEIHVSLSVSPIMAVDGKIVGAATVARDITERKQAEEALRKYHKQLEELVRESTGKLEAANKDQEGFSYSVAHDLRVPLRAIDGFSRILLTSYEDRLDDEGKRFLKVVRDNTKKMAQLIDDILAFSRVGRLEMSVSPIDMERLARSVWEELKITAAGRDLNVAIKPLPPSRGDPAMLRQVWVNLLANAIKFTRPQTMASIVVGGRAEGAEHVYYVRDNGVGFDMRYADMLFGVFQRLHGVDEFEGTGIGLAIVKRIMTRHGGRAWAEGKVGEGACFYFALPIYPDHS